MSNYLWILDAGHSGIDPKTGVYLTAPNKMHTFPDGLTVYEGVINREIVTRVITKLYGRHINYATCFHPYEDWSLPKRVDICDGWYARNKNSILVAIHSNAGGGSGCEIFTSPGQTKSDKIANIFCETYQKHFPDYPFRKDYADGDADKEADFYMLRKTDCPAILIENFFFDNRREAEFLLTPIGQDAIANCIVEAIEMVEKLNPI